jgi:tryptophan 2,3-dioxygenase
MTQLPQDPTVYGQSDLSYNDYLKIPELLSLQHPQSSPVHHDELLFIIIHQAYELWFKLALHEMTRVLEFLGQDKTLSARHHLVRIVEILRLGVAQIHILETMTPVDFLAFRDRLNPASGFQSLQFRELEFMTGLKDARYFSFFKNRPEVLAALQSRFDGPDLRQAIFGHLGRKGFPVSENFYENENSESSDDRVDTVKLLLDIYQEPQKHFELYLLLESVVDLDQQLALWREHHVRVVERIIGNKRGTGGSSGVGYLQSTTTKRCFPSLWEVRTALKLSK